MLENSYYILSTVMLVLVLGIYSFYGVRIISDSKLRTKKILSAFIPFLLWLVYIKLISGSALLLNLDLPPKFLLLILLPLIVLFIGFYITQRNNKIIAAIPSPIAIALQSFRIVVEYILLYTYFKKIIPITATFEGLNFDIIMGFSAPFIAFLVYKNLAKYRDIAVYWNYFGIFLILFVASVIGTSIYAPFIWGSEEILVDMAFLDFPYFLIPGFLAPLGIFLHVVSLIQLKHYEKIQSKS